MNKIPINKLKKHHLYYDGLLTQLEYVGVDLMKNIMFIPHSEHDYLLSSDGYIKFTCNSNGFFYNNEKKFVVNLEDDSNDILETVEVFAKGKKTACRKAKFKTPLSSNGNYLNAIKCK